ATEGSTIAGHVTLDGAGTPRRDAIEFSPIAFDPDVSPFGMGNVARAEIRDDWTFELKGISGPRRLRLVAAPDGWALKAILAHGIDVTDAILPFGTAAQSIPDLELVLTDRITRLVGAVGDRRGQSVSGYTCVVFATDRDKWYPGSRFVGIAEPKADRTFEVQGMPVGEYFAAALEDAPDEGGDAWRDPAFLETLTSRASRVMLTEGLTASVNLRLIIR
ncbi:MAG TPA: hypothetical protein VMU84_04345, partial [Thermoanaerobaculia bacterium]|nr:hypothetical protein [Thermoanaerobaculia bacterium]